MRRLLAFGRAWLIWLVVVGTTGSVAWADPPQRPAAPEPAQAAKSGLPDGPDAALERGLDQERARNWARAIGVYRDAVERWRDCGTDGKCSDRSPRSPKRYPGNVGRHIRNAGDDRKHRRGDHRDEDGRIQERKSSSGTIHHDPRYDGH
jgi:hypothetical protein